MNNLMSDDQINTLLNILDELIHLKNDLQEEKKCKREVRTLDTVISRLLNLWHVQIHKERKV